MTDHTVLGPNAVTEIERIVKEGETRTIKVGDREYVTREVYDPRKPEPEPKAIALSTLQSFADFVKDAAGTEKEYRAGVNGLFVHVEGPARVALRTGVFGEFHQRGLLAIATSPVGEFRFGEFADPESFNIALLSLFEATDDRARVFEVTGNLTTEAVQSIADDGISQAATLKASVVRRTQAEIRGTFTLRPFRSFAEIEQVPAQFVLRLRGGGDGRPPSCALFECDGGRWRLEAIRRVRDWLSGELPEVAIYG